MASRLNPYLNFNGNARQALEFYTSVFGGNAVALVRLACRDAQARLAGKGTLASVPQSTRDALAADLDDIVNEHRRLWLQRNRPGGLGDSVAWLDNLRLAYDTGEPDPHWGNW